MQDNSSVSISSYGSTVMAKNFMFKFFLTTKAMLDVQIKATVIGVIWKGSICRVSIWLLKVYGQGRFFFWPRTQTKN